MIRKYLLYAFAFTSLIFTSCMDSFLDRNPYGAIDETTFYTEAEHANGLLCETAMLEWTLGICTIGTRYDW